MSRFSWFLLCLLPDVLFCVMLRWNFCLVKSACTYCTRNGCGFWCSNMMSVFVSANASKMWQRSSVQAEYMIDIMNNVLFLHRQGKTQDFSAWRCQVRKDQLNTYYVRHIARLILSSVLLVIVSTWEPLPIDQRPSHGHALQSPVVCMKIERWAHEKVPSLVT